MDRRMKRPVRIRTTKKRIRTPAEREGRKVPLEALA